MQQCTVASESLARVRFQIVLPGASRFFAVEPAVQQRYAVDGGVTFIIVLSAASLAHFDALLRRLCGDNEDVARYRTFIVLNRVKVGLSVPI